MISPHLFLSSFFERTVNLPKVLPVKFPERHLLHFPDLTLLISYKGNSQSSLPQQGHLHFALQ